MTLRFPTFQILRSFLCVLLFVAGLCAGCWAIRESLPFPDVPLVKSKVDHFAARHDDYDTLFLGSSRMYYQIIPAIFDQLAAEQGEPVKSFNAGIAGLRPPEDAYYLDYLLRNPPQKLKWVFIELAGIRTSVDKDKIGTVREVYWHDLPRLWVLFKRALVVKPDAKAKKRKWTRNLKNRLEPFGDFIDHLPLFFRNQTNMGRASLLTARLISDRPWNPLPAISVIGEDKAGWIKTGRPEEMKGLQLDEYEKTLAERRVAPAKREPGDPVSQEALAAMIAKVEKLGARVVLVVPPTTSKRNFYPNHEIAKKTIVLDFCDLEKFPELYENRYRLDTDHLNTPGAEIFTPLLVKTWMAALKHHP